MPPILKAPSVALLASFVAFDENTDQPWNTSLDQTIFTYIKLYYQRIWNTERDTHSSDNWQTGATLKIPEVDTTKQYFKTRRQHQFFPHSVSVQELSLHWVFSRLDREK